MTTGDGHIGQRTDLSREPKYTQPSAGKTFFGPVYFHKGTEPYMTIARPTGSGGGVTAAEVNLEFVWDVVSHIHIGDKGLAYVVDADGTLIAHPDISLVLKKSNLKALPQVAAVEQCTWRRFFSLAPRPRCGGKNRLRTPRPIFQQN